MLTWIRRKEKREKTRQDVVEEDEVEVENIERNVLLEEIIAVTFPLVVPPRVNSVANCCPTTLVIKVEA